jgi:hypothetical protein
MIEWEVLRGVVHYGGHFLAPLALARLFDPKNIKKTSIILLSANLVDLDHLLSNPIFDPNRMSVGYHLLHSYPAIVLYFVLLFHTKTRCLGVGLLWHMVVDFTDYHIGQWIH